MKLDFNDYIRLRNARNKNIRLDSSDSLKLLKWGVIIETKMFWENRNSYLKDMRLFINGEISFENYQKKFDKQLKDNYNKISEFEKTPELVESFLMSDQDNEFLIDKQEKAFCRLIGEINDISNLYYVYEETQFQNNSYGLEPLSAAQLRYFIRHKLKKIFK